MIIVLKALAVIFYNLVHFIRANTSASFALRGSFLLADCLLWQLWSIIIVKYLKMEGNTIQLMQGLAEVLQLEKHWNWTEQQAFIQAAQIWASGSFYLLRRLTQTSIKIALRLKHIVWQLAIKTLFIKTVSVVTHWGLWRPKDLLKIKIMRIL